MLTFKQFLLLEAPSIESQLKSVAINRETALSLPNSGNPSKPGEKFPRVQTKAILPGELDWIAPETESSLQLIANKAPNVDNPNARGAYHPSDQTIVVNGVDNLNQSVKTVTHELAHHDQHMRQGGGERMRDRSPGIAPPTDKKNPFAYEEYAYTDVETNARTVTDADAAGRAYKTKLDAALEGLDPTKDAAKIQEIKNNLRSKVMDTHMAAERKISADSVRSILNAKDTTPAERAAAMDKVLDAAGKAERGTQEGIARSMQAVERGEYNPNTPSMKGGSVNRLMRGFGAAGEILDPVLSAGSRMATAGAQALSLGTEVAGGMAMAPLAIGTFTSPAGESFFDTMSSSEREAYEEARKRSNSQKVSDIISRGYNPQGSTPLQRQ